MILHNNTNSFKSFLATLPYPTFVAVIFGAFVTSALLTADLSKSSLNPALSGVRHEISRAASYVTLACSHLAENEALSLGEVIFRVAREHKIDSSLVVAVAARESSCNQDARSPKGALGVMQVLPSTARELGYVSPHELEENISAGVRYLSILSRRYKGDLRLALAAYNAGPESVRKYNGIPPYKETRNYVSSVLKTYRKLNKVAASDLNRLT